MGWNPRWRKDREKGAGGPPGHPTHRVCEKIIYYIVHHSACISYRDLELRRKWNQFTETPRPLWKILGRPQLLMISTTIEHVSILEHPWAYTSIRQDLLLMIWTTIEQKSFGNCIDEEYLFYYISSPWRYCSISFKSYQEHRRQNILRTLKF